jgi:ABC-2 type transport system permease protein
MWLTTAARQITSELSFWLDMTSAQVRAAMEQRLSFILQVLGMALNDFCWVGLWWLFFERFPRIQGWGFRDSCLLMAVGCLGFCFAFTLCRGLGRISELLRTAEFDIYLSYPRCLLLSVASSRCEMFALGDGLFGLLLFSLSGPTSLSEVLLFLIVSLLSGIMLAAFMLIVSSIGFFVRSFEAAADTAFFSVILLSLYPAAAFHGYLKLLMLSVVPVFWICYLPVDALRFVDWQLVPTLILSSFVFVALASAVFYHGMARYRRGECGLA